MKIYVYIYFGILDTILSELISLNLEHLLVLYYHTHLCVVPSGFIPAGHVPWGPRRSPSGKEEDNLAPRETQDSPKGRTASRGNLARLLHLQASCQPKLPAGFRRGGTGLATRPHTPALFSALRPPGGRQPTVGASPRCGLCLGVLPCGCWPSEAAGTGQTADPERAHGRRGEPT